MSIIILTIIVFACIFTKKSIFDAYISTFVPMKYICTKKSIFDAKRNIFVPRKCICTKKSIFVPKINLFSIYRGSEIIIMAYEINLKLTKSYKTKIVNSFSENKMHLS